MIQERLHKEIISNDIRVKDWFKTVSKDLRFPFYTSFDVRDSGVKVAPVDANIFPAGFNNICPQDKEASVEVVAAYLKNNYGHLSGVVALLTEEHTANAYYWENVRTIKELIEQAGFSVRITVPRPLSHVVEVKSASGNTVTVYPSEKRDGVLYIENEPVAFIICNNDFSEEKEEWSKGLTTIMNPPHELGWYKRRKSTFFSEYNELAKDFAQLLQIDPGHLQVQTETFDNFDPDSHESLEALAKDTDKFILSLKQKYDTLKMDYNPYVFIKNNSGTYGMGVVTAHSGDEIRNWNAKTRKQMRAAKGARAVTSVILQEGITTRFSQGGETAEPCIYLVGCDLVGGFLRAHSKKGVQENLNSPGAVFKRLCMADLLSDNSDCPMENAYGWVAKLGAIAVAREAKKINAALPPHTACG